MAVDHELRQNPGAAHSFNITYIMNHYRPILFTALAGLMALPAVADETDYDTFSTLRFGGYGEMVANFKDYDSNRFSGQPTGADHGHYNSIALPRFVLALDYKFSPKWVLGAEVEFEGGGVGVETELEASENGEYETEMEKGGEVALEQFHLTRLIDRAFNVRIGHMIVPVGLTNSHHEPINFYGTERPESATTILPSTWHETGLGIFGAFGRGHASFDYEAMVIAGLNPDGFGRDHWVADGKQGLFEKDNFSCPAYAARLNYTGVAGLRVGASGYFCPDPAKNSDKSNKYSRYTAAGKNTLYVMSADLQYRNRYLTVRGDVIYGNLAHSDVVSSVSLSNKSDYHSGAMRKVAHTALTYGAEAGVNLRTLLGLDRCPAIHPFVRYEYFNPQQSAEGNATVDARCQVSKWQAGVNWYALPNLVVKADYSNRRIGTQKVFGYDGTYNRENEFSVGIAYIGWFFRK